MFTRSIILGIIVIVAAGGCGNVEGIHEAIYGKYHRVSPADFGVYITIKRYATDCMIQEYDICKSKGYSDGDCGKLVLTSSRTQIEKNLSGRAKELWNGDYSVFGWHPNVGNAFADDEASDLAQAVKDLRSRGHQCLRVHWKPSGENWTTVQDAGVEECSWGERLKINGTPITCQR